MSRKGPFRPSLSLSLPPFLSTSLPHFPPSPHPVLADADGVSQHQLTMASLLNKHSPTLGANESPSADAVTSESTLASLFVQARLDVLKMITVLRSIAAQDEISRTRVEVLEGMCEMR